VNSYKVSKEIPFEQINIQDSFWLERIQVNSDSAIFHQWNMLEETGTIDNFRIVSGEINKSRRGYFYVDSDSHKWAEAAATILQSKKDDKLLKLLTCYLDLIISAQEQDGYIFTYNQIHFPNNRWINLQIEHELYILGHLIEASIIAYKLTKEEKYLNLGKKIADLLVKEFQNPSPKNTPGHPEIEIALIKLYRFSGEEKYLELAKRFIDTRGKFVFFGYQIFKENYSHSKRNEEVIKQKEAFYGLRVDDESLMSEWPKFGSKKQLFRFYLSAFTGKYLQQNKPLRRQRKPVGHCVRWGYLVTAATMILQETGDKQLLKALQSSWDAMVKKKMYVTGGIGSLPLTEGFGKDYELDNKSAYNETCAAISSVFWNWEMLLTLGDAKYADLTEWQLYNAVLVGMSSDGKSYFYRNPLEAGEFVERQDWYKTACCPSNISRTLAHMAKYIYSTDKDNLWVHQYIGNNSRICLDEKEDNSIDIKLESKLPWEGKIRIFFETKKKSDFTLNIRIPGWTKNPEITVNNKKLDNINFNISNLKTASDMQVYNAYYVIIQEEWFTKNVIEINFPLEIKIHKSPKKIKSNNTKCAFSRGPLVYCFESVDNPNLDLSDQKINLNKEVELKKDNNSIFLIIYNSKNQQLVARPYYLWGNKGKSSMKVWMRI